jgi:hypothetical protein
MKKVIKITESDLEKIIRKVISEQTIMGKELDFKQQPSNRSDYLGKGAGFERQNFPERSTPKIVTVPYRCLPQGMSSFANYVRIHKHELMRDLQVDEKTLLIMAKASMGIIGRETTFGEGTDFKDEAVEFLTSVGLGFIPQSAQSGWNKLRSMRGKSPQQMSLGPAQFTRDTWNSYGLDKKIGSYDESFNAISQGLGTIHRINDDYKLALKTGTGTGPSVNPIAVKQGKIKSLNGTGNNALDLAIVSHNMAGLINKWCQTSDPNYAGPCNQKVYQPFKDSKPEIKINVYTDKQIVNYFPNKKSGNLTSIGYLEEVANYINKFNCFTI